MKLFVLKKDISENRISVSGEDAVHLSVSLRSKPGERVSACDGEGLEYDCEIEKITKDTVTLKILSSRRCDSEPNFRAHLFQALPKGEKAELIIQKAVETGVFDITFVQSERCVAKLNENNASRKLERYGKISKAAAEQSGRGIIPEIKPPLAFGRALESVRGNGLNIFCYEGEGTESLKKILSENGNRSEDINLFIGPEGGWSENEFSLALKHEFFPACLGPRILRCETAPIFALSCIVYELEL